MFRFVSQARAAADGASRHPGRLPAFSCGKLVPAVGCFERNWGQPALSARSWRQSFAHVKLEDLWSRKVGSGRLGPVFACTLHGLGHFPADRGVRDSEPPFGVCYVVKLNVASAMFLVARVLAKEARDEATCSPSSAELQHRGSYASLDSVAQNS